MTVLPTLSIITPLYNRAWCIADSIASIGLAGQPAELIIVDDGSTDGSVAAAREAVATLGLGDQVTITSQANAGPGAARNTGAALARGEWLVFLDSDDLWLPWTLPRLVAALGAADPAVELVFPQSRSFADVDELAGLAEAPLASVIEPDLAAAARRHPGHEFGSCNAAIRRSAFQALGGFTDAVRCSEDSDLFLRVAGAVLLITAPVMVAVRRGPHASLTGNVREVLRGVDFMITAEKAGHYRGNADDRAAFMAGACAYGIRIALATGHPRLALRRYFAHLPRLMHARTRPYLLRLPLTPLLHLIRPATYPFRLRPR